MKPTFLSFLELDELLEVEEMTVGIMCVREMAAGMVEVVDRFKMGRRRGVKVTVMLLPRGVGMV